MENSPSNIVYFNTIREVYPGNSSYEIQTGGVLKNLRESTTIEKVRNGFESALAVQRGKLYPRVCLNSILHKFAFAKVRDYHKKYYRPENTYITITGDVDEEDIFKSLEPLEQKLVKRMGEYPPFVKPFQTVYGDIEKDINKKIQGGPSGFYS